MLLFPVLDPPIQRRVPYVTYGLIAANAIAFAAQSIAGLRASCEALGFIGGHPTLIRATTYMFLHGGWLHIAGNMFFLWFYARNAERRMGAPLFLAAYLLSGYAAVGLYWVFAPKSMIPLVGASGAIAGVMGMYLVLFPRRKITAAWWLLVGGVFQIHAIWFVGLWVSLDFINAVFLFKHSAVAYWAHVGGFSFGSLVTLALLLLRVPLRPIDAALSVEPVHRETFSEFNYIPAAHLSPAEPAGEPRIVATRIYRRDIPGAFALIPKKFLPVTEELRRSLEAVAPAGTPRPHCLATAVTIDGIQNLQQSLLAQGIDTLVYPAAEVLQEALVVRARELVARDGELAAVDEFGQLHPAKADEVFFLSAGHVGHSVIETRDSPILDVVVLRPIFTFRLTGGAIGRVRIGEQETDDVRQAAALLRGHFPHAWCTKTWQAFQEEGAIPPSGCFGDERAYGEMLLWAVQLASTPFYRAPQAR